MFSILSEQIGSKKEWFSEVLGGPEGFREVREACRKNFHQFSSNSIRRIPSYDQKTKNVNDKKSNDYLHVSVYRAKKGINNECIVFYDLLYDMLGSKT